MLDDDVSSLGSSLVTILSLLLLVLALRLFLFGDIHGLTLDDFTLGGADDGVVHAHELAVDIEEDGRRGVQNAWHK